MVKVIAFNGPPGCGKDTAVRFLLEQHSEIFRSQRFAMPLKIGAHSLLAVEDTGEDAYEETKDQPCADFFGLKPRDFYIWLSERVMKPAFGMDVFGHLWLREYGNWMQYACDVTDGEDKFVNLIPDCGFVEELQPLINHFGADQVMLIRIYRAGHDYSNDSRSYIKGVVPKELEVVNVNGEPMRFLQQVEHLLSINQVFAEFYQRS